MWRRSVGACRPLGLVLTVARTRGWVAVAELKNDVSTAEWKAGQARARRRAWTSGLLGFLMAPVLFVASWWLA